MQHWVDDHSGKLTDHPISEKGISRDLARIMHWAFNNDFCRHPTNFRSQQSDDARNLSEQLKKIAIFFPHRIPKHPYQTIREQ